LSFQESENIIKKRRATRRWDKFCVSVNRLQTTGGVICCLSGSRDLMGLREHSKIQRNGNVEFDFVLPSQS
jgi:hypothetical protein